MIFSAKRFAVTILALAACSLSLPAVSASGTDSGTVEIRGAVLQPGVYHLAPGARLNDAAVTGQVSSAAWFLGAALLRQKAIESQTRLKAGILFELRANDVHASAVNDAELRTLIQRLQNTVEPMEVTGRIRAKMDPLAQLFIANNGLLEDGDRLLYPRRPTQVRVMGAVVDDCILQHDPAMLLQDYLEACQRHELADRDTTYLIQPDAKVSQHGSAYWNQEDANVAVGAIIYVPLQNRKLAPTTSDLNDDIAAMLATQYQLGGRFNE